MEVIGIDTRIIERAARVLGKNKPSLSKLDVYDPKYYPPRDDERERVLRYFLVMVAMDHRLSRPGKPYEGYVDGEFYHGADLLYRLGAKKYYDDPDFFSPAHLTEISADEVREWLSVGDVSPPDIVVRTYLLRDLGLKLVKLYDGSVEKLIGGYRVRLHGSISSPGFVERLRVFRAYEDPVEKKAMLLAKFLEARDLIEIMDELDLAIDNHLSRIAYRLGIVMVSGPLWDKITRGVEVTWEEDVLLRMTIRRAYRLLAHKSGVHPGLLDDHLWIMGRKICLRDKEPLCNKCLFRNFCMARKNPKFMVDEHTYYNTWYY